jgi:hypothetical protein
VVCKGYWGQNGTREEKGAWGLPLRPGHGERTIGGLAGFTIFVLGEDGSIPSPVPGGWKSVKRGSLDEAGLRLESKSARSCGKPNNP